MDTTQQITDLQVAEEFITEVLEWMGTWDESEVENIKKQLASAINGNHDGFDIVYYLKNHFGWEADAELVMILDSVDNVRENLALESSCARSK